MKFVICEPGPVEDPWEMPGATPVPHTWINGGQRTLYGLAAGLSAAGYEVELRGRMCPDAAGEIFEAVGARVVLPPDPRRPTAEDVVVTTGGLSDPLQFARLALSPARVILMLLEPTGMFGWPFVAGWTMPDPMHVEADQVARPEHFRAMSAAGFTLWTNNINTANAACDAGVECACLGLTQPLAYPDPLPKQYDLAVIGDNRWASLARQVAQQVDATCLEIPRVDRLDLLQQLSSAKVLVWPSRLEGHSRIQCEARAMGTVPVALPNPFAVGLDRAGGAVVVEDIELMPDAIRALLDDPRELRALSERGVRTVRDSEEWSDYVTRVGAIAAEFLSSEGFAAREAVAMMGDAIQVDLAEPLVTARQLADDRFDEIMELFATRDDLIRRSAAKDIQLEQLDRHVAELAFQIEKLNHEIHVMVGSRGWRTLETLRHVWRRVRHRPAG